MQKDLGIIAEKVWQSVKGVASFFSYGLHTADFASENQQ